LAKRIEANRLDPRVRRMLARLQNALHGKTWETVRGLVEGRVARRELMMQQREAALLADSTAEGGAWLLGMWAAQRRDVELLALLERIGDKDAQPLTLEQYLRERAAAAAAAACAAPSAACGATLVEHESGEGGDHAA
jgi:hypothetical protein